MRGLENIWKNLPYPPNGVVTVEGDSVSSAAIRLRIFFMPLIRSDAFADAYNTRFGALSVDVDNVGVTVRVIAAHVSNGISQPLAV